MPLQGFSIPESFPEKGMNNHYFCIGVKATDSADKMSKIYSAKLLSCDINQWNKMQRQVKSGIFKGAFGGIFGKLVILHNPTLKPAPVKKAEPKVKALSPKHKKAVNEMMEEGKGEEDLQEIADAINVDVERVKAYIQSF